MPGFRVLKAVRLSFLLANRYFVVSETGEYNSYGDGVVFNEYDDLADASIDWLSPGAERRRAVAERGPSHRAPDGHGLLARR
jgi:hypothetical protein